MAHPLLADAFVAANIDDAVSPFVERLSEEEVAWMRDQLALWLAEDDEASATLKAAHPRNVDQSGERRSPLGEDEEIDPAAARGSAEHGGPRRS